MPNYRLMLQNVQAPVNLEDENFAPLSVPTDVRAVLEETAVRYEIVARDSGKTLDWWMGPSAGNRMVNPDPEALEYIVANLADNAVKYSESVVKISVAITGGELRIEVSDDGPGIRPGTSRRSSNPAGRRKSSAGRRKHPRDWAFTSRGPWRDVAAGTQSWIQPEVRDLRSGRCSRCRYPTSTPDPRTRRSTGVCSIWVSPRSPSVEGPCDAFSR